jgi:methylmalonyl-CoA/ethylmalonyl-CoA epimerase
VLFGRIDHIGIAVTDLEASAELYAQQFDMREQHRETVEEQGVEAVLYEVGDGHIELIKPLSADSGVAKFIERNGEGMHHIAYAVDDIDAALERVKAAGLRLIDEQPRKGIRGSRVAFLHPKSTAGVLTEIVEPAGHQPG